MLKVNERCAYYRLRMHSHSTEPTARLLPQAERAEYEINAIASTILVLELTSRCKRRATGLEQ